jgi:hypothetical protein
MLARTRFLADRALLRVPASFARLASDAKEKPALRPMPEQTMRVDETMPSPEDDELARRRRRALRSWAEERLGVERAALMSILATHRVQIPGGSSEANELMDDLLGWKAESVSK